jgi:two-component system sensor histidine kinase KdpD
VTTLPESVVLASVDPVLIEHALVNLIENAVKHAGDGELAITGRERDGAIELEVADRGPGLPADPEPLFEKFARNAPSSVPGAGLGLAIARGIARAHGGELRAGNRPHGGAVFTLRIPVGPDRPTLSPEDPVEAR